MDRELSLELGGPSEDGRGRTPKARVKSGQFGEDKSKRASPVSVQRYASMVALCDYNPQTELLHTTLGWSVTLPSEGRAAISSAWSLKSKIPRPNVHSESILSQVEESSGILFGGKGKFSDELTSHAERLVADWETFFTHRVLFNQAQSSTSELDYKIGQGDHDILLFLGPTLPKLVGRIAYTNHARTKTVAVIAPTTRRGEIPLQNRWGWNPEPFPRFCHDAAQRRWQTSEKCGVACNAPRISEFDVIDAIGDGFSGRIPKDVISGPAKWLWHADRIQKIVDGDSIVTELSIWQNTSTRVPLGIAQAARAAANRHYAEIWQAHSEAIRLSASAKEKLKHFLQTIENPIIARVGPEESGKPVADLLRARARLEYSMLLAEGSLTDDTATDFPEPPTLDKLLSNVAQQVGPSFEKPLV